MIQTCMNRRLAKYILAKNSERSFLTFIRRDQVEKIHLFVITLFLEKRLSSYFSI